MSCTRKLAPSLLVKGHDYERLALALQYAATEEDIDFIGIIGRAGVSPPSLTALVRCLSVYRQTARPSCICNSCLIQCRGYVPREGCMYFRGRSPRK